MNVAQTMSLVVPPVQELKRRALRRADGEHTMFPTLIALRDDRVLCVVTSPRLSVSLDCAPTLAVGLLPQTLVLAAQVRLPEQAETDDLPGADSRPGPASGDAIAYTVMSRDREAALAVQRYAIGDDGELVFDRPTSGAPTDREVMNHLAAAMSHAPLDPAGVVDKSQESGPAPASTRTGRPDQEPGGKVYLSAERGRHVLDAGTARAAHGKVKGVAGQVLFLAGSPAHATALLAHGMPQELLLGHGDR